MLDVIVLIAMAITAGAFAAGLTVEAGLPLLPVLIATTALFLVMASSYIVLGRSARSVSGARIEEIEEALEIIDNDLQRIDRVEDDVARLDGRSDRGDRGFGGDRLRESSRSLDRAQEPATEEEPATDFGGVDERTESLRAEIETESTEKTGKVGLLKGLLSRGSDNLTPETPSEASVETDDPWDAPSDPPIVEEILEVEEVEVEIEIEEEPEPEAVIETMAELEPETEIEIETEVETEIEIEVETVEETVEEIEEILDEEPIDESDAPAPLTMEEEDAVEAIEAVEEAEAEEIAELLEEPVTAADVDDDDDDDDDDDEEDAMRQTIREAVEAERIELFLQPTVTLPERKLRYFEALTRVRTENDDLVLPADYVPVAKRAGMMPLIDNALLVKSVHTLQQVPEESEVQGLFCNISLHSLLDPDYFPELVEFMEENNSLSDRLIFEVSQPEMVGLTEAEFSCLDTLGALGYSFCLDNVSDLDADFASLSDRHFRYVKLSAAKFLDVPGRIAADLKRRLDGLGIQLIIEKVEDEGNVAELLDHGIDLAQGDLFDEPKPADDALANEGAGAA